LLPDNEDINSACLHSAPLCESVEVVTARIGELRDFTTILVEPTPPEHTLGGMSLQPCIRPRMETPGRAVTRR
ncbi:hypothetical protein POSPLADRAFT_1146297, partial [Postia placenta MAD-698-R-SB12]